MSTLYYIPNINIAQAYDQRYADVDIHYEVLDKMAGFFGRNMPVHYHDRFFQVHYVCSGDVWVRLDEKHYRQKGPMFFLTPPTVAHAFSTMEGSNGHVLTVRHSLLWPLLQSCPSLIPHGRVPPLCVSMQELAPNSRETMHQVNHLLSALGDECASMCPAAAVARVALTQLVFVHLLRLAQCSAEAQPIRHDEAHFFHRFTALIEQKYRAHWPLADYAGYLGVSVARLNAICRRISGLSAKRLVFERQIQEAKRLLLFTSASAHAVAYELGFKDPAYFSRFFMHQCGSSPRQWRKSHSSNAPDG